MTVHMKYTSEQITDFLFELISECKTHKDYAYLVDDVEANEWLLALELAYAIIKKEPKLDINAISAFRVLFYYFKERNVKSSIIDFTKEI